MTILVDTFWALAMLVYWPVLLYRMLWLGKSRQGWGERWGYIPVRAGDEPLIWLHCVSVGEVNLVRTLVEGLRKEMPDHRLAISATTDTGMARARELFGKEALVFHYPLDFSWVVRRVLKRLRPSLIVLAELEVWPNLALLAEQARVPVVVVNGRISARAFRRYRIILPAVRLMMSKLTAVAAQDEAIAQRFIELGTPADRVRVLGTMKFDTAQIVDELAGTGPLAEAVGLPPREAPNRPGVWVCGQTGPGEEAIVLGAYQHLLKLFPELRLVIVPRKPERFNEVAELIRQKGCQIVRRSEHPDERGMRNAECGIESAADAKRDSGHPQPNSELKTQNSKLTSNSHPPVPIPPVVLIDTMGELRTVYPLASVVLVGRTLAPMGGSDVMEVAGLGKPIIVGPYTDNFSEPVRLLKEAGGLIQLPEPSRDIHQSLEFPDWSAFLAEAIRNLLVNPELAKDMGTKGRHVLEANKGATEAHLKLIQTVLAERDHA